MAGKKKLKKMYIHVAGQTMDTHKKIIKKLKKKGAKKVTDSKASDVIIVFCPIVSRFETDIESALSSLAVHTKESQHENVIIVAMHHTHNPEITLSTNKRTDNEAVILLVDCLFHETKGLLDCQQNKKAIKQIRKQMGFSKYINIL